MLAIRGLFQVGGVSCEGGDSALYFLGMWQPPTCHSLLLQQFMLSFLALPARHPSLIALSRSTTQFKKIPNNEYLLEVCVRVCQREASLPHQVAARGVGGAGCTSGSTSLGRLRGEDISWPRSLCGQVVVGEFQSCVWFTGFLFLSLLKWINELQCSHTVGHWQWMLTDPTLLNQLKVYGFSHSFPRMLVWPTADSSQRYTDVLCVGNLLVSF